MKLLIEQIYTIWNMSKNKMTTILSMNEAKAYNHVSSAKLLHNLRKRDISNEIIFWVDNFMTNKHITLIINKKSMFIHKVNVNISQEFFVSLIFYFFYNANILEFLKRTRHKITTINFVNDINILKTSIKNNCKTLKKNARRMRDMKMQT